MTWFRGFKINISGRILIKVKHVYCVDISIFLIIFPSSTNRNRSRGSFFDIAFIAYPAYWENAKPKVNLMAEQKIQSQEDCWHMQMHIKHSYTHISYCFGFLLINFKDSTSM